MGSLLGLALALAPTRAPLLPPPPQQQQQQQPRQPLLNPLRLPPHRLLHGWGADAAAAAAAAAHWRSAAYALTCRAASEAGARKGSTNSGGGSSNSSGGGGGGGGATLADINRAEVEATRARKGWLDPSISARDRKRAALGAAPLQQSPLPGALALSAADAGALLSARDWALARRAKWVGAQVLGVAAGGAGGGGTASSAGGALSGTVTWVGRTYFTLRGREGCATLLKAGCVVRVQWPTRLAPGAGGGVAVCVPAAAMAEAKALT